MARYDKTMFKSTGVQHTGKEAAASKALGTANASFAKNVGQIGKDMQERDNLAAASKFSVDLDANSKIWAVEFKDDQEGLNKAYETFYAENSQDLRGKTGQQAANIGNRYITLTNADYEVNKAEKKYETEQLDIIQARAQDGDNSELYAGKGDYNVGTSFLNSTVDSITSDDALNTYQKAAMIQTANDGYSLSANMAVVDNFIRDGDTDGLTSYLSNLKNNRMPSFIAGADETNNFASNDAKDKVLTYGAAKIKAAQAATVAGAKVLKDDLAEVAKGFKTSIDTGHEITDTQLNDYVDAAALTNDPVIIDDANEMVQNYKLLHDDVVNDDGTVSPSFYNLTFQQQEQWLQQVTDDPKHAGNSKLIEQAQAIHKATGNADISFLAGREDYDFVPLFSVPKEQWSDVINNRKKLMHITKERTGIDVGMFTEAEIIELGNQIEAGDINTIAEIADGAGSQAYDVFATLAKDKPSVAMAGSLFLDGKADVGTSIIQGNKMVGETPENFLPKKNFYSQIIEGNETDLSKLFGNNTLQQKATKDAIYARYSYLMSKKPVTAEATTTLDSDVYDQAVSDVLPPIVEVSSSYFAADIDAVSPNPKWTADEAQEKTDEWIDSLTAEDFPGVPVWVVNDLRGDFGLSPLGNGKFGIVNVSNGQFVINSNGGLATITYSE